ncbi:MAG: replicative DNA helicase [Thermodesulfobacteriota bacterium]
MAVQAATDFALQRVPPQSVEAERSVIGGVLIDNDSIAKILEILSADGSDFYREAHRKLFRLMVSLFDNHTPIDIVTVTDALKTSDALESVGGLSYLGALVESTPTAANIGYYARIVKEKSVLRKLITASTEIINGCYEGGESLEDFLDDAERLIFQISHEKEKRSFYPLKEIIKDTFHAIEQLYEKKEHVTGVPTGFKDLDNLTSGLQRSDLIIVAGRPSMGKTAFCLNIAQHAATDEGRPVAVFSLEMSKEQLVQRLLASKARVDLNRLRSGFLREEDWGKLTAAIGNLYEAPIYIDDTPALTVLEMKAKARRWKSELGLELVIVDYLQLMRGRSRADNREQEIADISRSLKAMAKELDLPVIALSQLSRRAEQREGSKPQLADLRESGAIEQDADVVMFIYRRAQYEPCDCPKDICTCGRRKDAEIRVAKQRNGPTDDIKLTFLNEFTTFVDQVQVDIGEVTGEWVE